MTDQSLKKYLKESKYNNLRPVKNPNIKGRKLGPFEPYDSNNLEHNNPKKYIYYSAGGTVYQHTIEALRKIGADKPIEMLATMLHDIGKGVTATQENGLPKYLGHAKKSMELVKGIAERLKLSNKDRDALIFAVSNHMKFHDLLKMKNSKIAKLVNNDHWDILVAVARADEFSRGDAFMHAGEFEKIVDKAIKIKEKFGMATVNNQLKLVDGQHVMNLTGLKPGKKVGEIIRKVTTYIMDNDITDQKEIDELIIKETI